MDLLPHVRLLPLAARGNTRQEIQDRSRALMRGALPHVCDEYDDGDYTVVTPKEVIAIMVFVES